MSDIITGGRNVDENVVLNGTFCTVLTHNSSHDKDLWNNIFVHDSLFTYIPVFTHFDDFPTAVQAIENLKQRPGAYLFTILDKNNIAVGSFSYLDIRPAHGVLEIGTVLFSSLMQRSSIATDAIYLILRYAFDDLHFRRVEWKCDSRNVRSHNAALRFGFTFEGTFRQHMIIKGQNRDSDYFSILDKEWPEVKKSYEKWMDPSNFDDNGNQINTLVSFREH